MGATSPRVGAFAMILLLMTSAVAVPPRVAAAAEPTVVAITGYDIETTAAPGWGGWPYAYAGTVTDTGRTIDTWNPTPIVNLTDGSGTLNDGETSVGQLFTNRPDMAGVPVDPRIVLHLAEPVTVQSIELIGDMGGYSWAAGFTTQVTAEIGASSVTVEPVGYGPIGYFGIPENDRVVLDGTPLGGIATDTIALTHFIVAWPYGDIDQWVIAEIQVIGTPAPVDTTPPIVTYSDHPATYSQADQVRITCTATDDVALVSSTCEDVDAPAWTFPVGLNTLTAKAWDAAGNEGAGETTFTTTVTYEAMETLTYAWVTKPGIADQLVTYLANAAKAEAKGNLKAEASNLASYRSLLLAQQDKSIDAYHGGILSARSWML